MERTKERVSKSGRLSKKREAPLGQRAGETEAERGETEGRGRRRPRGGESKLGVLI